MVWYGIDDDTLYLLDVLNQIFTAIYTLEAFIKIIAMGKDYFKDNWCLFDFFIVVSAWVGIVLFQLF